MLTNSAQAGTERTMKRKIALMKDFILHLPLVAHR